MSRATLESRWKTARLVITHVLGAPRIHYNVGRKPGVGHVTLVKSRAVTARHLRSDRWEDFCYRSEVVAGPKIRWYATHYSLINFPAEMPPFSISIVFFITSHPTVLPHA